MLVSLSMNKKKHKLTPMRAAHFGCTHEVLVSKYDSFLSLIDPLDVPRVELHKQVGGCLLVHKDYPPTHQKKFTIYP